MKRKIFSGVYKKVAIYTPAQQTNKSSVQPLCNYFRKAQPYEKNVRQKFSKRKQTRNIKYKATFLRV